MIKLKNTKYRLTILSFLLLFTFVFSSNSITAKASDTEKDQPKAEFNLTSKSVVRGGDFKLSIYNLTKNQKVLFRISSSDILNIADADKKEVIIEGLKVGEATVTATIKEGLKTVSTLECAVTVGPPPVSIVFSKPSITLTVGKKLTLKPIIKPNNAVANPRFTSSDKDIVSVSSSGKITANAVGKAKIKVMINEDKFDECIINVIETGDSDEEAE